MNCVKYAQVKRFILYIHRFIHSDAFFVFFCRNKYRENSISIHDFETDIERFESPICCWGLNFEQREQANLILAYIAWLLLDLKLLTWATDPSHRETRLHVRSGLSVFIASTDLEKSSQNLRAKLWLFDVFVRLLREKWWKWKKTLIAVIRGKTMMTMVMMMSSWKTAE